MEASPPGADADRRALGILLAFLLMRAIFAALIGFGVDESYTLAVSRTLELSYFDHPPLHQWIAHFAARAFGEDFGARVPFMLLFAATGWLIYRLTALLFGPRAGLIALFAVNAAPFFFASAGTWVVPDGPLLFALAFAALALARLFFTEEGERRAWALWLLAGAGFGLAGLSKYSAALSGAGVIVFLLLSARERRWLLNPQPYVAAALALAMTAPVFLWNARHGWASFAFQGGRGVAAGGLKPLQAVGMALGEVAYLSPWLFVPLVLALAAGFRERDARRLFLLCLSLPAILVFTLTPLWGAPGLPHWTMPGWLFAFPLLGAWLDARVASDRTLGRAAAGATALIMGAAALVAVQTATGWPLRLLPRAPDPTLEAFDWGALRDAPGMTPAPDFVVATRWADAGKIAMALGPRVPVFVYSWDPRGWAFVPGDAAKTGADGVLIVRADEFPAIREAVKPLFAAWGEPSAVTLTRFGAPAMRLALVRGSGLTRTLPLPYPPRR